MRFHTTTTQPIFLTVLLTAVLLVGPARSAQAGCGCDKPAPAPATIIPQAAFSGMPVTLFHNSFQAGQAWKVTFQNNTTRLTTTATVVSKRTLTDPTGATRVPQLVVAVPKVSMGPTRITATRDGFSFTVSEAQFTVIGKPVAVAEQAGSLVVKKYATGVGADGTVYLSVAGFNNVCQAMEFRATLDNYPLRFGMGDAAITNHQGFFVDALDTYSADHFSILPPVGTSSNILDYFRHSFAQYCVDHQSGGIKEVDAQDPNWHRDGTAHTDYSTLIFAISGRLSNGSTPKPGAATFDLQLQANVAPESATSAMLGSDEGSLGGLSAPYGE
ncbi:MAG: hypothetical protein HOP18_06475 [Deltaproteobacteria bacterium]|nr:hypothetical protein [Deltaproteobacteria bacterium]